MKKYMVATLLMINSISSFAISPECSNAIDQALFHASESAALQNQAQTLQEISNIEDSGLIARANDARVTAMLTRQDAKRICK